jgi:hypothetical protein
VVRNAEGSNLHEISNEPRRTGVIAAEDSTEKGLCLVQAAL